MSTLPYMKASVTCSIERLIPQSLRVQAQVILASQDCWNKSGDCAKSCARRSVCFGS